MTDCIYATDTHSPWGLCTCTAIQCASTTRIAHVTNKVLTAPVDFHTRYPQGYDKYSATPPDYVLVRSGFCCPEKCPYYTPPTSSSDESSSSSSSSSSEGGEGTEPTEP